MKRLLLLAGLTVPLAAHDFWIEPSSFRPARGEAVTASLRVGENFRGEPIERDGIERIERNGTIVVAYRSRTFGKAALSREKFDAYLHEEGLHIAPRTDGVQRERFARFAKAVVGTAPENVGALGWRFELVPLSGSRFRLLYDAKPLPDARVVAISRDGKRVQARTGADGTVTLDLTRGVWLVKSVHMIPAPPESGVEWESLWASLTLQR